MIELYIHIQLNINVFAVTGYPTTKDKMRVRPSTGRTEGWLVFVHVCVHGCVHAYLRKAMNLYKILCDIFWRYDTTICI